MNEKRKIVIIEDNYDHNKRVGEYAVNILKKYGYEEYEVISIKKYCKELKKIIFDNSIKIYIIDLVLGIGSNSIDGYEICSMIRDEANDWNSPIIIMSVHDFQNDIMSDRLSILTYVPKDNSFDTNIKESIKKAIHIIESTHLFEINQFTKTAISEICYVKKEKESKYCSIVTFYGEFRKRISLKNINEELHFKQWNDHLLINEKNIIFVGKELIIFKNNIQIKPENI